MKRTLFKIPDFFKVATGVISSITVFYISQGEIVEVIKKQNPWGDVLATSGIRQIHEARCIDTKTKT